MYKPIFSEDVGEVLGVILALQHSGHGYLLTRIFQPGVSEVVTCKCLRLSL